MLLLSLEKKLLLLLTRGSVRRPRQLIHPMSQFRPVFVERVNLGCDLECMDLRIRWWLNALFDTNAPTLSQPVIYVLHHSSHS